MYVILMYEIYGACLKEKLSSIIVRDIDDRGSIMIVTIQKIETYKRVYLLLSIIGLKLSRRNIEDIQGVSKSRVYMLVTDFSCKNNTINVIQVTDQNFFLVEMYRL